MYPGTIFNWIDRSQFDTNDIAVLDDSPLFMVVGSFDKGPEKLMEVSGSEFNQLFGTMNFAKHGQNSIQTQKIINAGARVLIKRVCAADATLANVVLVANVEFVDANDGSGLKKANIKWEAKNITSATSFDDVLTAAKALYNKDNGVFPLVVVTDNGRGASSKAFRLVPDYNTSKGIGTMFYTAAVFEGTTTVESVPATLNPYTIYSGTAYGLDKDLLTQVKAHTIPDIFDVFTATISNETGISEDKVKSYDLVRGYDSTGKAIDKIAVTLDSVNINADYGVELKEGDNGNFGDYPANTTPWTTAIANFYKGIGPDATDEIWDVDQHKIAAICDANFPFTVKNAISEFVTFRKDCVFFRDLGTNLNTFIQIETAKNQNLINNNFIADYMTSYSIKDPLTKKNITVTMMYDFAECLVNHFDNGVFNPVAGTANKFILTDAIKGTINYVPIVTPSVNQKQAIDDLKVNYAIFQDDDCVVQSLYTSQDENSQLSYINNVLAIQEVARAVRTACPKNRFTLTRGYDLSSYAKAVNNVLSEFSSNFSTLRFTYTRNKLQSAQKIFYASIEFAFNDWAQTEIFDLIAINNEEVN